MIDTVPSIIHSDRREQLLSLADREGTTTLKVQ